MGITVDSVTYNVKVVYESISRAFELVEGANTGTAINGRTIRDILGTKYSYSLSVEPDPAHPTDYDAFYQKITEPVDSHTVTMPYGQTTITFSAMVESGTDTYRGIIGAKRWSGLSVRFTAITPQR